MPLDCHHSKFEWDDDYRCWKCWRVIRASTLKRVINFINSLQVVIDSEEDKPGQANKELNALLKILEKVYDNKAD